MDQMTSLVIDIIEKRSRGLISVCRTTNIRGQIILIQFSLRKFAVLWEMIWWRQLVTSLHQGRFSRRLIALF